MSSDISVQCIIHIFHNILIFIWIVAVNFKYVWRRWIIHYIKFSFETGHFFICKFLFCTL